MTNKTLSRSMYAVSMYWYHTKKHNSEITKVDVPESYLFWCQFMHVAVWCFRGGSNRFTKFTEGWSRRTSIWGRFLLRPRSNRRGGRRNRRTNNIIIISCCSTSTHNHPVHQRPGKESEGLWKRANGLRTDEKNEKNRKKVKKKSKKNLENGVYFLQNFTPFLQIRRFSALLTAPS